VRGWLNIVKTSKARDKIRKYVQEKDKIPVISKKYAEKKETQKEKSGILIARGVKNPSFKLAQCCLPNPGDSVVGFAAKTGMVTVHKKNCNKISDEKVSKKKIKIEWRQDYSDFIELKVEALDRIGLLADVLNTIASTGTNLQSANAKILGEGMAECSFKVKIDDLDHAKDLIQRVGKLQGVKKIYFGNLGI